MGLGPRLEARQSQQLVMTPQLQQAIKLLALTNLELTAFVEAEIEKNPLLEADPPDRAESDGAAEPAEQPDPPPELAAQGADTLVAEGNALADAPLDADPAAETKEYGAADGAAPPAGPAEGGEPGDIDALAERRPALADHLLAQAAAQLTGTNLAVATYLIDQIDEAGYYRGDLAEAAAALGARRLTVESILRMIQTFEPTGVGARTLAECLALQAKEAGLFDRAMDRLLRNLEVLARGDLAALRRLTGLGPAELNALIRVVRRFDPKPGLAWGGEPAPPVAPDLFVRRSAEGWRVELNSATLPRVLINRAYLAQVAPSAKGGAKTFLADCLQSANWLVKALDQRARTIVKVAAEIVRQQEGFFEHGVRHMRPLNLRTVAGVVGAHESTVSRVTANKYLLCERGLFELKFFFTPALAVVGGTEQVSTEAVKRRIRELIAAEQPDSVLSDDALVDLLRGEGLDVARRTVAKYREAMHIGSSVQRRRTLLMAS